MNKLACTNENADWVRALRNPAAFPHPVDAVSVVETHISWVILTGDNAYKIKKPVDLGFVNFSTLERRKFYCEEEVRLNRRTAPDTYLGVVPIATVNGDLYFGREPAVEYAVHMRQFPARARLDLRLRAGLVDAAVMRRAGRDIAAFHLGLEPVETHTRVTSVARAPDPALRNLQHLDAERLGPRARLMLAGLRAWTQDEAERLGPVFRARLASGWVRECHGDLHLANLFDRDGRVIPFDCLEFDPTLSRIDVASDIAFLVMDLMAYDRADLSYALLNAWLEETGDYGMLEVLRFYLVYRALVRVKVATIRMGQGALGPKSNAARDAAHYLDLASRLSIVPATVQAVMMNGPSGSGKTWVSERLAEQFPAIRVRSDRERKRLPGLRGALPAAAVYSKEATRRTYAEIAGICDRVLRLGFNVIADATFLDRSHRKQFYNMAARAHAPVVIVQCEAPRALLRERIRARQSSRSDISDADLIVLERQLAGLDRLDTAEQRQRVLMSAVGPFDALSLAEEVRAVGLARHAA